ncbi:putative ribonuclease h protein [Fagus crenata]
MSAITRLRLITWEVSRLNHVIQDSPSKSITNRIEPTSSIVIKILTFRHHLFIVLHYEQDCSIISSHPYTIHVLMCRIRTSQSFNPTTNEEAVNQWSPRNGRGEESSWQQAVQSASEKWNEMVENEKTEETKLPVTAAVHDEVPAMEHNKYFETVDIGSPANDLQCAKATFVLNLRAKQVVLPFSGNKELIWNSVDKKGGRLGGSSDFNWLNDFVTNSGAIDLGFYGPQFTWSNKREGLANIHERLDR